MDIRGIYLIDINSHRLDREDLPVNSILPYNGNTGLLWLKKALNDRGIDASLYPVFNEPIPIIDTIEKIIGSSDDGINIVCFSCSDHVVEEALLLSFKLMEANKKIVTVAGGASFYDHHACLDYLNQKCFHIVNRGGCLPAVNWLTDIYSGKYTIKDFSRPLNYYNLPPGLYGIKQNKAEGSGVGKHPVFKTEVPVSISPNLKKKDIPVIGLPVKGHCTNACGYCASNSAPAQPLEAVLNGVNKALGNRERDKVYEIRLDGNSPLSPGNIDQNIEVFNRINSLLPNAYVSSYIDPGYLLKKDHYDKLLQVVTGNRLRKVVFGLDAANENISKKIGRNYNGQPRPQGMLDKEVEVIGAFINDVNTMINTRGKEVLELRLHYILTPFDDYSTVRKVLDNLFHLGNTIYNKMVEPTLAYWLLWPLNGTWINKTYTGNKMPIPPFRQWNWKKSLLPDEFIQLVPALINITTKSLSPWAAYFYTLTALSMLLSIDENFSNIDNVKIYLPQNRGSKKDIELLNQLFGSFKSKLITLVDSPQTDRLSALRTIFLAFYMTLKEIKGNRGSFSNT